MVSSKSKTICLMLALIFVVFATVACLGASAANAAVLKQGSKGETVRKVQTKLKNWGYYNGSIDGVYGKQTKSAVQYFQRKKAVQYDMAAEIDIAAAA